MALFSPSNPVVYHYEINLNCFLRGCLCFQRNSHRHRTGRKPSHLEKQGGVTHLIVDGKPFIIFGGQVSNPIGFPDRMERAWPKFKSLNANTIEFPIYWEQIEPQEGHLISAAWTKIIRGLRSQDLRAVPLWFGTYKNGAMDYVPAWVKD